MTNLLIIQTSMKPGPGSNVKSACRGAAAIISQTLSGVGITNSFFDLRERPFPFFYGKQAESMNEPVVVEAVNLITVATKLIFVMPCYWGAISGASKNFFEIMCGPAYQGLAVDNTIFAGKTAAFFLIGSDEESAIASKEFCLKLSSRISLHLFCSPLHIGNPQHNPAVLGDLVRSGIRLGIEMSGHALKDKIGAKGLAYVG